MTFISLNIEYRAVVDINSKVVEFRIQSSVMEFSTIQRGKSLETYGKKSRRGKKSTDKDKRIKELKWFSENTITLEEYVQGMSGHTNI